MQVHEHRDDSTPEQDAALARDALASGDFADATHHIGLALAGNPTQSDWLGILDQIIQRSPDPLALVPLDGDETSFVTAATRAYILAAQGRWEEAFELVGSVVVVRPDVPYLRWAEQWLARPGVLQGLTFEQLAATLLVPAAKLAGGLPPSTPRDDPRHANLQVAARIVRSVRDLHPKESFAFFTGSMLSRRLGKFDEALQLARRAHELEPSWRNAVGVANTYKDMGRVAEAISWFRKALTLDPQDVSAHLDIGDMLVRAGRYREALDEYQRVLAKEKDHSWATASIHFVRFKLTGDPKERLALIRLAEGEERNDRAIELAAELQPVR